jgi:serine/threonine protein kinase
MKPTYHGRMPDASAFDQALARTRRGGSGSPAQARTLAGMACLLGLPCRDPLGPPLEEELPAGHVLDGRFILREAIGRSGMATIYRAEDLASGDVVAVKVPLMRIESDPVSFGRFEREARIGAAFRNPLLLGFITPDAPTSRPYIVTEFLDGCTLAMVIHQAGVVPERDALRIAGVVCEALLHMHERGVIHRDLKPANIMICRSGTTAMTRARISTASASSSIRC